MRPGEKAHVLIHAPVSSYVGVVAVDQSVYLQQDKNQLTTAKVTFFCFFLVPNPFLKQSFVFQLYDEIRRLDEYKPLTVKRYDCAWRLHFKCSCDCYRYRKESNPPLAKPRPLPAVDVNGPPGVKRDVGRESPSIIRTRKCCARRCNLIYYPQYCSYVQASSYFTV